MAGAARPVTMPGDGVEPLGAVRGLIIAVVVAAVFWAAAWWLVVR